jgi:peptidyl-tRNA hydrolase, PTH1 family
VYLVAGLGNPGERYSRSRHNVGFLVVDQIARSFNIPVEKKKFDSLYAECRLGKERLILVKPQTFMNLSGTSVRQWVAFYRLPLENMIMIHDDLDVELGRIKLVHGGGSGGHKGIESTVQELGTVDFPRLKVGIGRPRYGEAVEDFVLSPFYSDQRELMESIINKAAQAAEVWAREGISNAMNVFNRGQNFQKEVNT